MKIIKAITVDGCAKEYFPILILMAISQYVAGLTNISFVGSMISDTAILLSC